ncbi:fumarylacetoacetate hydrolase family protein [Bacteroidota bacterium]
MKVYKTKGGIVIEHKGQLYMSYADWDEFFTQEDVFSFVIRQIESQTASDKLADLLSNSLLPPIENQEVWAAGVTYIRSRSARMEESKDAGGGDFYDKVYDAERPELFFKSTPHRVSGHKEGVRIRKDSSWNVPEPELTLAINSSGKIIGYSLGNDMSSRDIEGQNPLYLPQAKTYDKSAALGPCIYLTKEPLSPETQILLSIERDNKPVFTGDVAISQIKRKFEELVEFLYRETTFPYGCFLMTGTGIIPPNDFTLQQGDVIHISADPIGTLTNIVE